LEERGGGIGGLHEVFANEESVKTGGPEGLQIGVSAQARFGYSDAVIGNVFDQFARDFDVDREGFEIAIVDAEDASAGGQRAVEFGASVHFDERLHVEFAAKGNKVTEERVIESGDNQKKAVSIIGAGFPYLPGIEDKIFTQRGNRDGFTGVAEILE